MLEALDPEERRKLAQIQPGCVWFGVRESENNLAAFDKFCSTAFGEDYLEVFLKYSAGDIVPPPTLRGYLSDLSNLYGAWFLELAMTFPPGLLVEHGIEVNIGCVLGENGFSCKILLESPIYEPYTSCSASTAVIM